MLLISNIYEIDSADVDLSALVVYSIATFGGSGRETVINFGGDGGCGGSGDGGFDRSDSDISSGVVIISETLAISMRQRYGFIVN
ncbi:Hypothetical predicted protein [Octopus vulgaris]|uniref:Uncharacterized protein n=1 Tax=Octopus vulgaris TaxID=6645 RepID=A0AA36B6V9_OCTVU|nr:Hypothetical predicted protein [Octopus vulgaris]